MVIDLRSDTVTRPSPGMRKAMAEAEVGDDVFGEDPTVNRLQEVVAGLLGKEAALFVPSGTMGNEICIKAWTSPGDEVILDENSHVYLYETAAPGMLSGVQLKAIRADRGVIDPAVAAASIRPGAYYFPRTRLMSVENTHGRSAGAVYPLAALRALSVVAGEKKIPLHMDGARLWNASAASGVDVREYAGCVSSLSVCFSKGLGAPVGSAVIGERAFIAEARRIRKIFGGGMRQAGILAAAALYGLKHNLERMAEDHANARTIAGKLKQIPGIEVLPVESNMVIVDLGSADRDRVLEQLASRGVLLTPEGGTSIRAVTHLDVSAAQAESAAGIVAETIDSIERRERLS